MQLTGRLAELAGGYDRSGDWPAESMEALGRAGAWRWIISKAYGGEGWTPLQIMEGYEAVGRGCHVTVTAEEKHERLVWYCRLFMF